jgi:hypothetical protein
VRAQLVANESFPLHCVNLHGPLYCCQDAKLLEASKLTILVQSGL